MLRCKNIFGFSALALVAACTTHRVQNLATPPAVGDRLTLMTYNVENLFDTRQDEGREDYTFLPLTLKQNQKHRQVCMKVVSVSRRNDCLELDWNESVLRSKLVRLSDVIRQVNSGRGPDILIMPEVENIHVVQQLNREFLQDLGYRAEVLLEGPDPRGIDVAILSRLPIAEAPKMNKIPFEPKKSGDKEWMDRSRGILQATFRHPDGDLITVFGVHFPSQANPTYWREQAIAELNRLKAKLPEDRIIVAAGDFNISNEEDVRHGLYRELLGSKWLVSHYLGCGSCQGTHYFGFSWSFLDAILVDPKHYHNSKSSWHIDPNSIQVVKSSRYQLSTFMSPARFDPKSPEGVSDHLPLVAQLVRKPRPE